MSKTPPFNFHLTKEAPCDVDACPWNCPCLGEGRGCPVDGRHSKTNGIIKSIGRSCGVCK